MSRALDKMKLAKILSRTTSESEGEVVASMAIANRMLAEADTSWEVLLVGTVKSKAGVVRGGASSPPGFIRPAQGRDIKDAFEYLLESKTLASATRIWVENQRRAVLAAAGKKRYEEEPLGRFMSGKDQRILFDLLHEETKRRSGT